jgi:hypothetical protein
MLLGMNKGIHPPHDQHLEVCMQVGYVMTISDSPASATPEQQACDAAELEVREASTATRSTTTLSHCMGAGLTHNLLIVIDAHSFTRVFKRLSG